MGLHYEYVPQLAKSSLNSWKRNCEPIFLRIGKYPLALVSNMDETSVFLDMVPNKTFAKKSSRSVTVRTSGCEKKHLTVVLITAVCGDILPPMIIFPGKTDHTIKDLTVPETSVLLPRKSFVLMNV